jgi:Polyketide cyclase / dehydrase and lipid transport
MSPASFFVNPSGWIKGNFTMLGASYSTVVAQPPETVFRVVSDPMRDTFWNPNAISVRNISGGSPAVGARYQGNYLRFGEAKLEIVRFEPPLVVEIAGIGKQGRFTYSFTIEQAEGGASSLREDLRFYLRGFRRLAQPFVSRSVAANLKAIGEAAKTPPGAATGGQTAVGADSDRPKELIYGLRVRLKTRKPNTPPENATPRTKYARLSGQFAPPIRSSRRSRRLSRFESQRSRSSPA